jgi:hypothetical protein
VQEAEGARGFGARRRAKGECVSARALVNEMLSGSKVGCMSVAHSQVASNRGRQRYCTLALWGPWYKRPKQRTQSHTTATPLWQGPLRQAVAAEAVVDAVLRKEGGLTHRATRRRRRLSIRGLQRLVAAAGSANLGEGGARRCGSGGTGLLPLRRHEGWQRGLW